MPSIQEKTVALTREKNGVYDIHWQSALPNLEIYLEEAGKNPTAEYPWREATRLLERIANNGEFMLALVFSPDHQQVTALPLPEIFFANDTRVPLGHPTVLSSCDLDDVSKVAHLLLETGDQTQNVLLLQQNLGESRRGKPLAIGYWEPHEASLHHLSRGYNQWIESELAELSRDETQKAS